MSRWFVAAVESSLRRLTAQLPCQVGALGALVVHMAKRSLGLVAPRAGFFHVHVLSTRLQPNSRCPLIPA